MNKKGFTIVEMLIVISMTSFFAYSAIFLPTLLLMDYKDYRELSDYTTDIININKVVTKDLANLGIDIEEIDEDNLSIGDIIYNFSDSGLYRKNNEINLKISDKPSGYKIEHYEANKILNIYSEDVDLKFNINNSSFDLYKKRGNDNEK